MRGEGGGGGGGIWHREARPGSNLAKLVGRERVFAAPLKLFNFVNVFRCVSRNSVAKL